MDKFLTRKSYGKLLVTECQALEETTRAESHLVLRTPSPGLKATYSRKRPLFKMDNTTRSTLSPSEKRSDNSRHIHAESSLFRQSIDTPEGPLKKTKSEQTYLDFGQKSFGERTTCTKCKMMYTMGEESDELEHKRFCSKVKDGIIFQSRAHERVYSTFEFDHQVLSRIIEIRRSDLPGTVHKAKEILRLMNEELGSSDDNDMDGEAKLFVFICGKKAAGAVLVEPAKEAFKIVAKNATAPSGVHRQDDSIVCDTSQSFPVLMGISKIWTSPEYRRKGVARMLVDAARDKFIYGYVVPVSQIAFTQPTPRGRQFAEDYVSPNDLLIYN